MVPDKIIHNMQAIQKHTYHFSNAYIVISPSHDSMDETIAGEEVEISEEARKMAEKEMESFSDKPGHERVFELIVRKDDVTWKTIILELVNTNKMDPWNINISLLTKEYLSTIKKLQQHDFRISGKMILAAALLLKLKSIRLLEGDMNALDALFASTHEQEEDIADLTDEVLPSSYQNMDMHKLIPKTPQPRKRKVSIYDLVEALEKALEVKERRILRRMPSLEIEIPKKTLDVSVLMGHLVDKIENLMSKSKNRIYFTDLLPGQEKEDKVITFIPLLHLDNARHVDLEQHEHFGPIEVRMMDGSQIQKDIAKELSK